MTRRRPKGPSAELRIYFLGLFMMSLLGVIVVRLWWEQVARGDLWRKKISNRSEVTVRIPSVRGEIRDRNNFSLVQNRASYDVDFYLPDMVRGYRMAHPKEGIPTTSYTAPVRQMLKEKKEADVVQIVNTEVAPQLRRLGLAVDYNSERLQKHYRNDTEVPFTYMEDIERDRDSHILARFCENNLGLPGVDISVRPVRQYVYGAMGAHLLGYVGAPEDIQTLPDVKSYTFYQPDVEGKSQVERYLDQYIRGTPGVRVMSRNVKGIIEGELSRTAPKQGNNVLLTLDLRLQYIAERALRMGNIGRGAAVVVDPRNGEILAMASVPSYDPNMFIPSVSAPDWEMLTKDETDPLTNRAIQSYAPGSTFKTVTALAGLRAGLTAKNTFNCSGGVQYGAKYMKCWVVDRHMAPHGNLNLSDAIKYSCNAFFYQWGNKAKIEEIDAVGDALGLGHRTGVPLSGESPGVLPGKEWLARVSPQERWSDGYTANVSIGQGSCEASPLQMAMVTSAIANRGISYEPRLVYRVLDQEGHDAVGPDGQVLVPHASKVRANLRDSGISEEQIELVRRGMWKVVNDGGGTGRKAKVAGAVVENKPQTDAERAVVAGQKEEEGRFVIKGNIEVAGKTGTAQFWREVNGKREKDNHTWFICFAPYDAPRYAICIMVEGGKSGGGTSAPIAQKILSEALALDMGYKPVVTKLEPARGHFRMMDEVNYKNIMEAVKNDNPDEETAEHTEAPPDRARQKQVQARPDIRAGADARGRVAAPQPEKRGFLQRLFGGGRKDNPPPPSRPFFGPRR